MKVIIRGEVKEKAYQSSCKTCKSILEFLKSDGVILTDRNDLVLKVRCPVCGGDVYTSV